MCDYSLCGIPNRLAIEGEELVVHRFRTGSLGLASPADLQMRERLRGAALGTTFWQRLKSGLKSYLTESDPSATAPAVCIPPGARLVVMGIPGELQRLCGVSQEEDAVFTQISAEVNRYRDAVRFRNGCQIRLQDLREGLHVRVLSLSCTPELPPAASAVGSLFLVS